MTTPSTTPMDLLRVDGLTTQIRVGGTWYDAVREVSFSVSAARPWPSSANRAAARASPPSR